MGWDAAKGSSTASAEQSTSTAGGSRVPSVGSRLDEVWPLWRETVNLTADELEGWLATTASMGAGENGDPDEATAHQSGLRVLGILRTDRADLTRADVAHMRKVVDVVHRHLAHRPAGDVTDTQWRHSLMNWGHDPLR